jgi:hypothetical protein
MRDVVNNSLEEIVRLRRGLIAHGYRVIPCDGKRAQGLNWPNAKWRADQMEGLARNYPHATNTGILTGEVVAIDVDAPDPEASEALAAMVAALPRSSLAPYRVGKAPKRLYVFRTNAPRTKAATSAYAMNGAKCQVEVLGIGNQFIAYGVHPDTHQSYEWFNGSPAETPASDLPLIEPVNVDALLARAERYLAESGTLMKRAGRQPAVRASEMRPPSDHPWSNLNRRALANLAAWVPSLELEGLRRYRSGYHAVASFRPSNSTTATRRGRALNIQPEGICDHADGNRGYSPIDLVAVCLGLKTAEAVDWLTGHIGENDRPSININFSSIIAKGLLRAAH